MNDKIFYISSRGGSATEWLSKVLSMHPRIVAWHGTRSIPPYDSGTNDMPPEQFMKGLKICMQQCQNMKIFGAIHGYYGLSAKEAVENENGLFSFIVRHPVTRINSLMNHYVLQIKDNPVHYSKLARKITFSKQDVYEFYEKITQNYSIEQTGLLDFRILGSDKDINQSYTINLIRTFFDFALTFIRLDLECIENTNEKQMIVMEKMVASKEYFINSVWPNVAPHITTDTLYIKDIFKTEASNRHSPGLSPWEEIFFDKWPSLFREIFYYTSRVINVEKMKNNYALAGYTLPV